VTVNGVSPYTQPAITTATKTPTRLRDVPQSVTVVTKELMQDQLMMSVGDVMRYVPGVSVHQGENNRDQIIVRGNSSSADFYIDGVRDDVQYYRDLYNTERIEALKGPNAMIFGRGGAGGVVNRVMKDAGFRPLGEFSVQGGMSGNKRVTGDFGRPVNEKLAFRVNGMFEDSESFRDHVTLNRKGITPTVTFEPTRSTTISARYEYLDDSRVADRGITSYQGRPANVPDNTYYGDPDQSHVQANVNLASGLIEHRRGALTVRNHTLVGGYDRSYQNFVPGAVTPNMSQVALTAYNNATQRTNFFNQTDVTYLAATGSPHVAGRHRVRAPGHRQLPEHRLFRQHRHDHAGPIQCTDDQDARHLPAECHRCGQSPRRAGCRSVRAGPGGTLFSSAGRRRVAIRSLRPDVPQQPQRR
jgi:catecholate siderophore receptor